MKAGRQDSHYTPSAFEIAAPRSNKINNPTFMSSASHGAVSLSSDHLGSAGLGCVLWQQEEGSDRKTARSDILYLPTSDPNIQGEML